MKNNLVTLKEVVLESLLFAYPTRRETITAWFNLNEIADDESWKICEKISLGELIKYVIFGFSVDEIVL